MSKGGGMVSAVVTRPPREMLGRKALVMAFRAPASEGDGACDQAAHLGQHLSSAQHQEQISTAKQNLPAGQEHSCRLSLGHLSHALKAARCTPVLGSTELLAVLAVC